MGLVQSVLEGMSRPRADAEGGSSGAPAPWDDYWYYAVGAGSSTGMRITADTVKRIACVYACVSVIGKLVFIRSSCLVAIAADCHRQQPADPVLADCVVLAQPAGIRPSVGRCEKLRIVGRRWAAIEQVTQSPDRKNLREERHFISGRVISLYTF